MKKLLLLLVYCSLVVVSFSQSYDPLKVNKKAISFFTDAQAKAEEEKIKEALGLLDQAISIDNRYVDAYLLKALLHSDQKKYDDCLAAYHSAFAIDSVYTFEYRLPYAINLAGKGDFQQALKEVNKLLPTPSGRLHPVKTNHCPSWEIFCAPSFSSVFTLPSAGFTNCQSPFTFLL